MPDSDAKVEQSALDQLFAEAEATASKQIDPPQETEVLPSNTVAKCDHAGSDVSSRRWCRNCKQLICQFCWSVLDPSYCVSCMQNVDLTVRESTLVDDEGVVHHGRLITPSTGFNRLRYVPNGCTTAKMLCEMDMSETLDYVQAYQEAVKDAERSLDFRRIRLSAGQLHLDELRDQQRRVLRTDKTKYPIKTVTVDPKTGSQVKKTASSTQMLQMLQALEALKKLKQQQHKKES